MGILREKKRAGDVLLLAVVDDGLGDGGDVVSLKDESKALPRWPEVPKATRWAGMAGSGRRE